MDKIYIFDITDNDFRECTNNLMLYSIKDSFLTPLINDFEKGGAEFFDFKKIISYLNKHKINTITTYSPIDSDTLCSHPYEIGDFTDEEILRGADFDRFAHLEFSPLKEQIKLLDENNIHINYLNNKDAYDLESTLKLHYLPG